MSEINTMTVEQMAAEMAKLKAENESLKHKAKTKDGRHVTANGLTLAVGKAGGLSIYGLGRFPVTLFKGQWERIINASSDIQEYLNSPANVFAEKAKKEDQAA